MIPLIRNGQAALIKKIVNKKKKKAKNIFSRCLESNKTAAKSTYLDPKFKRIGFGVESNADRAICY